MVSLLTASFLPFRLHNYYIDHILKELQGLFLLLTCHGTYNEDEKVDYHYG